MDYWILGEAFMQNYYIVFDASETDASGNELLRVGVPVLSTGGSDLIIELLLGIGIFILLLFVTICVVKCYKNRKQTKVDQKAADLLERHRRENQDTEDCEAMEDASYTLNQHATTTSESDLADLDPNELLNQ